MPIARCAADDDNYRRLGAGESYEKVGVFHLVSTQVVIPARDQRNAGVRFTPESGKLLAALS